MGETFLCHGRIIITFLEKIIAAADLSAGSIGLPAVLSEIPSID
jgi:hypothetical protein